MSGTECRWRENEGRDFRAGQLWRKEAKGCNRHTDGVSSRIVGARRKQVRGGQAGMLMESGPAAEGGFAAVKEGRSDNGGNETVLKVMRRRILLEQGRWRTRFRAEVETTTAGRDRVESGRPD